MLPQSVFYNPNSKKVIIKLDILFWNHVRHVLRTKEERNFSAYYQCRKMFSGFREAYAPDDVLFREGLAYLMLNRILHLWQHHGCIVEESGC